MANSDSAGDRALGAELMRGARDILPVVIATIPFAMVYGTLANQHGLTFTETVLMSAAVYGGASQFVALEFWANPLPFWTILMSALAVNLRHILYSAAIGRKMRRWSPTARYTGFALLTDPIFALAELRGGEERLSVGYYFGLGVPLYLNWVAMTAIGAVVGNLIGNPQAIGLDFVVTAYFMFIIVGFRSRPNALPVIGVSASAAILGYLTLGPPWHFAAGALGGMAIAALLAKPKQATP